VLVGFAAANLPTFCPPTRGYTIVPNRDKLNYSNMVQRLKIGVNEG